MGKIFLSDVRSAAAKQGKKITLGKKELQALIDKAGETSEKDSIIDLIIKEYGVVRMERQESDMLLSLPAQQGSNRSSNMSFEANDATLASDESGEFLKLKFGSMPNFKLPMTSFTADLSSLTFENIKKDARDIFIREMVDKSRANEDKEEAVLSGLGGRKGILNFLNSSFQISSTDIDKQIINNQGLINVEYASQLIEKRLTGTLQYNRSENATKEEKDLVKLVDTLQAGVGSAKQFAGILYILSDATMTGDVFQGKRSGKTVNEMIALLNLKKQGEALINAGVKVKATAYSAGSEAIEEFKKIVEGSSDPKFIMEEAKNFYIKLQEETGGTSLAIAQKMYSGSGSKDTKQTVHVADLIFEVDGQKRYIDVKIGVGKTKTSGSRYKWSSDLKTSINSIYSNSLLEEQAKQDFFKQIEIIINYLFYKIFNGTVTNSMFENGTIKQIITYALLSSNVFVYYYRSIYKDKEGFVQPTWLLTLKGYVWYSDFFQVVADVLFPKDNKSSQTVSLQMRYALRDATKIADKKKKERLLKHQNQEGVKQMVELLQKMRVSKEELEDFKIFADLFINSNNIYFMLDVDDVYKKVQDKINSPDGK